MFNGSRIHLAQGPTGASGPTLQTSRLCHVKLALSQRCSALRICTAAAVVAPAVHRNATESRICLNAVLLAQTLNMSKGWKNPNIGILAFCGWVKLGSCFRYLTVSFKCPGAWQCEPEGVHMVNWLHIAHGCLYGYSDVLTLLSNLHFSTLAVLFQEQQKACETYTNRNIRCKHRNLSLLTAINLE